MGILLGVPLAPSSLPNNQWEDVRIIWRGVDGSTWDLTDPTSGVYLNRDGVEGLHHVDFQEWVQKSPTVPGQQFNGAQAEPRELFFPIEVYNENGSAEWAQQNDQWWKSLSPRAYGEVTVVLPGGRRFTIAARFKPKAGKAFASDPIHDGWAAYGVTLVADAPFFRGLPRAESWKANPAPLPFFEKNGPHLVNIASGHTIGSASFDNPGDEEAWPIWRAFGPLETVEVGLAGMIVDLPVVDAGKVIVIDTDPVDQRLIQYDYVPATPGQAAQFINPVSRTAELTRRDDFAPIPPGQKVKLQLALTGAGSVQVEITPLHWRVL
ncbi:hypothetical protein [Arthrobacter sp. B1805]|uniref:hypothetical protein n=1 Tax=Arthrobacter sp. B1805 TaxID=2058892 RepID=UPI0015E33ADB|nr:hypothetical protein [Arthrobacter sp. B1805]